MIKSNFALVALALLAGCSFIPAYERPTAPVPEHFAGVNDAKASALPGWRAFYSEPALHTLIEAALANNRDLRIALARVDEARGLAGIARAERFPSLNAQASRTASRTPSDVIGFSQARTITRRTDLGLAIPSFELDFWGRVAALSDAARAQYLASDEAAKSFQISLIGDVANTWFQLNELVERERLANETLKNRADSLDIIRKRRDAGLATDLDALAAESLTESARAQGAELRRQRLQMENALSLLTGMAIKLPQASDVSKQSAPPELAPGLPSEVLLRRPDVRAAEQRLIAANANVGAARAAFFPRIALTANFGTASRELSGLFGTGSNTWLFQPALSLPLFNAGQAQANLDVAQARKVAAVADYEKTIQQAFREVADALAARTTYADQLAALAANLRSQQDRLTRVKARADAGIATYLEVLDASREAFSAEQTLVTIRRQVLSTAVVLYKALGGGEEGGAGLEK